MSKANYFNSETSNWDIEKDITSSEYGSYGEEFKTDIAITREMLRVIISSYFKSLVDAPSVTEAPLKFLHYWYFQEMLTESNLFHEIRFPEKKDIVFPLSGTEYPFENYDGEIKKFWIGEIFSRMYFFQIYVQTPSAKEILSGDPSCIDMAIDKIIEIGHGLDVMWEEGDDEDDKYNEYLLISKDMKAIVGTEMSPIHNDVEEI